MITATLQQLRRRYTRPYLTLSELLADHFSHLTSEEYLYTLIRSGAIDLELRKIHQSRKAPNVVTLQELARYLDSQLEQENAA